MAMAAHMAEAWQGGFAFPTQNHAASRLYGCASVSHHLRTDSTAFSLTRKAPLIVGSDVRGRARSLSQTVRCASGSQGDSGDKKVVIVGAGPAGLVLAHFLLARNEGFQVTIAERRSDPRKSAKASIRSYSLGLGVRGRNALKRVSEDVWQAVKAKGVPSDKFTLHIGKRAIALRQESKDLVTEPSVLINRADLCSALLDTLERAYPNPNHLRILFDAPCTAVDLAARTATLGGGAAAAAAAERLPYDLLVAADGVNSVVRAAVADAAAAAAPGRTPFQFAMAKLNGTLKVLHQEMPAALDPSSVHAMSGTVKREGMADERIGLFWVPERNRTTGARQACVLVNWDPASAPITLLSLKTPEEVRAYINEAVPAVGADGVSLEAARQFLDQRETINFVNKCSRYHDSDGRVLLLGDAAHCTGGASGQGCNSALQDSEVFDQALGRAGGDVTRALELYTEARVPEGHALLDLSIHQAPRSPLLRAGFLLVNGLESLGHRLVPALIPPPTQNLLTQTDLPFSEIYRRKKGMMEIVKADNAKYGVFTGY